MATGIVHVYANALVQAFSKTVGWKAASPDTFKCTLHTSTYAPNYGTHAFQSDLTNEVANGNGYTTGGNTLTSVSAALQASSALTAWSSGATMQLGEVRRKVADNGHVYQVVAVSGAQTTGGVEPTWPTTAGGTVVDNNVTWAEVGSHVLKLTGTIPPWSASTFTCRYGVVADTTPGTAGTNPLMACIDFQADQSPSNGTFTITTDTDGILVIPIRAN